MELIRAFSRLGKGDAGIAGGKGASLGEMTQAGIPVPPGYVVLACAFERFLEEADLNQELDTILDGVNRQEMRSVDLASEKIKQLIMSAHMPEDIAQAIRENFTSLDAEYVAVRSSATAEDGASAAWAGQLESYLNTTEETLIENVQRCWASLFTPRAIFYRFEKGMHGDKISVAVVVQKMIQSEVSGIAFSVHPVTEDYNQMIIEAGFGLGEAIVSGQVTPDSYVIEKSPRRIIDKNVTYQGRALVRAKDGGNEWIELSEQEGNKPALSDEQAMELGEIVLRIEDHYGFPCDIEWAFEAGNFFITQSRPITTLQGKKVDKTTALFNPEEYEYLWSSHEINFIFVSCYLFPIFRENDFLLIYDWPKKELKWFLGKKEHQRLSAYGIDFYRHQFDDWKKYIQEVTNRGRALVEESKSDRASVSSMSVDELVGKFKDRVELFQRMGDLYFNTEFFVVDEAEKMISEDPGKYPDLKERMDQLGAIKFEAAKILTDLYTYSHVFQPYVDEIGKRFNRPDIQWLTYREIEDVAQEKEVAPSDREATYWILGKKTDWQIVSGGEAKAVMDSFDASFFSGGGDTIKGVVANPGVHRGIVRIIRTVFSESITGEIEKVQKGDVLVANTTKPELMPACQKAGAIVTDEGGLTSHAAIVSRELGIPCIVGTKNATKILKDGDIVEVDANNGVINIISSSAKDVDPIITTIKKTEWFQDWNGTFPLFDCSLANDAIFTTLEKNFGGSISATLIIFREGIASAWLPVKEYEATGTHLAQKALTSTQAAEWSAAYKRETDAVLKGIAQPPEDFLKHIEDFHAHYRDHASYNLGAKMTFNFLPLSADPAIAQMLEDARKYSEPLYKKTNDFFREAMRAIGSREPGYSEETLLMMTIDELKTYLSGQGLPAHSVLRDRYSCSAIYWDRSGMHLLSGSDVREIESYWMRGLNTDGVKGISVYPGLVSGTCRIVLDYKNVEIREGEILITGMTDPNFVPNMKKAAAIVTDAGGMLSHAAIVARELKKPCIVGTKFATQVFKGGDMVEVDADNGIVRKI